MKLRRKLIHPSQSGVRYIAGGAHHRLEPGAELGAAAARDDEDRVALVRGQRAQHGQHVLAGLRVEAGLRQQRPVVVQHKQPPVRPARNSCNAIRILRAGLIIGLFTRLDHLRSGRLRKVFKNPSTILR